MPRLFIIVRDEFKKAYVFMYICHKVCFITNNILCIYICEKVEYLYVIKTNYLAIKVTLVALGDFNSLALHCAHLTCDAVEKRFLSGFCYCF